MGQVINRTGFAANAWESTITVPLEEYVDGEAMLLRADDNPAAVAAHFNTLRLIVIPFAAFADGRGFSLAAQLRALGYQGYLRARGHLLVDQFRAALSSGFDDIEISDTQAVRNPEAQWQAVAHSPGYRSRIFT